MLSISPMPTMLIKMTIETFRSEDEDDHEYEFSVLSTRTSKHSRPQSLLSFWPVVGIESSGRTRFSEHVQSIRFALSTNQICWI